MKWIITFFKKIFGKKKKPEGPRVNVILKGAPKSNNPKIRVALHGGQVAKIVKIIAEYHFNNNFKGSRAGRRQAWAKFYRAFKKGFYDSPKDVQSNILMENRGLFTHG